MMKKVAPIVFDELIQQYKDKGRQITLIDEDEFFGTILCVDGKSVAMRVQPMAWDDSMMPIPNNIKEVSKEDFDKLKEKNKIMGTNVYNNVLFVNHKPIAKLNSKSENQNKKKMDANYIPFDMTEIILGFFVALIDTVICNFAAILFFTFITSTFGDSNQPWDFHPWYLYVFLDYGYIWFIVACLIWVTGYANRNTDRKYYESAFSFLALPIQFASIFTNKKSNNTKHYYFWTTYFN